MKHSTAEPLARLLKQHPRYAPSRNHIGRSATGRAHGDFRWAEGTPILASAEVVGPDDQVIHILIMDMVRHGDWSLVIYPGERKPTIAEFRNELLQDGQLFLCWSYKPTKQDGRNEERRERFRDAMGGIEVRLQIPQSSEEFDVFLTKLLELSRVRDDAHSLTAAVPDSPAENSRRAAGAGAHSSVPSAPASNQLENRSGARTAKLGWILQGNPQRFDIDAYLAWSPQFIYWRVPVSHTRFQLGDRIFLWRSGQAAGVIAVGRVVEGPALPDDLKNRDALGEQFWLGSQPARSEPKVGIELEDTRLTATEAMLPRAAILESPILGKSTIIRRPNGTVFALTAEEWDALEKLWVQQRHDLAAEEGQMRLVAHKRRERSEAVRRAKIADLIAQHGGLFCEICGVDGAAYPESVRERLFEVHHIRPLADATRPVLTKVADLSVLCANCHRAVHGTAEVESNYSRLVGHFERTARPDRNGIPGAGASRPRT